MFNFEYIFRKYHYPLSLYAQKFTGNEDEALDLVQDVFTASWERKLDFSDEEYIKAYLFNAVRNSCLNQLKHREVVRKHESQVQLDLLQMELAYYHSGEKSLIEQENLQKIYDAIDSLSEKHKEVIILSRFEGLKNKEIAEKLDIPIRTVETRLFRALSALKEKISDKFMYIFLNIIRLM